MTKFVWEYETFPFKNYLAKIAHADACCDSDMLQNAYLFPQLLNAMIVPFTVLLFIAKTSL